MASSKKGKKTYYPPKTFDDDLEGLIDLYVAKGWSFSGVDLEALKADKETQRSERRDHDALESQYLSEHERYGLAQEARFHRFAAALNAARGAFRDDKATMAELDRFKRSATRAKPAKPAGA